MTQMHVMHAFEDAVLNAMARFFRGLDSTVKVLYCLNEVALLL